MAADQLICAILLLAISITVWFLFRRLGGSHLLQFAALFFVLMAGITFSRQWFGMHAVPQPERYHLEMELALCLAIVFSIGVLCQRLQPRYKTVLFAICCVLLLLQAGNYRDFARRMLQSIDITSTVEYQVARWLHDNLPYQRVFATGSTQFWLNVFSDNTQIGGGADQALVNPTIPAVKFGIPYTENDGERTAMWLRVYGAKAVVVGGPKSRDSFKDYHDPYKFDGVLPKLWRDGDDVIYSVPQRSASLAHIILDADVVPRAPVNVEDTDPIRAYHAALENPELPLADLVWIKSHHGTIHADLKKDHLISVQVTYHPGWRAFVNGQRRQIREDGLGFMIIEPECDGPCTINLVYDGGIEMTLVKLASASALLGVFFWWAISRRRHIKS